MDARARELLVARVCSGTVRLRVGDSVYSLCHPGREAVYVAQEVYHEQLADAAHEGLYDDAQLLDYLVGAGYWSEKDQELLQKLPKEIDEFKVRLFRANFRTNERRAVRSALNAARAALNELEERRHGHDHLGRAGVAAIARSRYLVGVSLRKDGRPVFGAATFWDEPCGLLDRVMAAYAEARVSDGDFREAARTDPWRSVWACRRAEGTVFGVPACEYTEEQKALAAYSLLYDSVYEHPECPAEDIVADDDMLDGWLIHQRRERDAGRAKKAGEEAVSNEKIRSSDEVYLVADTKDDARRVVEMNDEHSRMIQQQRFRHLKEKGVVHELEMPDTKLRLRTEATQKLLGAMKGQ